MDYITVYEIINDKANPYLYIPFFITGIIFVLLLIGIIKGRTFKLNSGQIVGIVLLVVFICLSIYNFNQINNYKDILEDYKNQEYLVVEGKIEKFKGLSEENQQETFVVNGVKFAVPNNIGYSHTSLSDSYIREDGQNVRIGYMIIDDINYIVKLEIVA